MSLVKCSYETSRHMPTWNEIDKADETTLNWLCNSVGEPGNLKAIVSPNLLKITNKVIEDRLEYNLSLSFR